MKLLNELLSLSESTKGSTLVDLMINDKLITNKTKNEVWTGNFDCSGEIDENSEITSLEGAPKKVIGNFDCSHNNLTSLEGAPEEVTGYFVCSSNSNLASLEGAPNKVGNFYCVNNPKITSLKDIHKQVTQMNGKFYSSSNYLKGGTPIKSHVLGLLLIKGCKGVELDNKEVEAILNKYLPNTRGNKGLIECQSELLDADLEDFAEL